MLLLHQILLFYSKHHEILMSMVTDPYEKYQWKILALYPQYFESYLKKLFFMIFEVSAFDVELMAVSFSSFSADVLKLLILTEVRWIKPTAF